MKSTLALLAVSLVLLGCSHPINIVGEGDVTSASGNRDCLLEYYQAGQASCTKNFVTGNYVETYYAIARSGWRFHRWVNYCANANTNTCGFNVSSGLTSQFVGITVPPLVAIFRPLVNTGFDSLFIGHSLFTPFTSSLPFYAGEAGFTGHSQSVFFAGGVLGSPQELWNNATSRAAIQTVLDTGNVELFGMAFHPDAPNVQGYKNWVDYALKKNPDTRFFVGAPWPWNPGASNSATYAAAWQSGRHSVVHSLIDNLRSQYPHVDFFCVPYGQAAVELHTRFNNGNLPDVPNLVNPLAGAAVFTDSDSTSAHANQILLDLGGLLWLSSIYGVDLSSYSYTPPGYITNLKEIGKVLIDGHDPGYNAPYL